MTKIQKQWKFKPVRRCYFLTNPYLGRDLKKLSPQYVGPYEVLAVDGVNVTIKKGRTTQKVHVNIVTSLPIPLSKDSVHLFVRLYELQVYINCILAYRENPVV